MISKIYKEGETLFKFIKKFFCEIVRKTSEKFHFITQK